MSCVVQNLSSWIHEVLDDDIHEGPHGRADDIHHEFNKAMEKTIRADDIHREFNEAMEKPIRENRPLQGFQVDLTTAFDYISPTLAEKLMRKARMPTAIVGVSKTLIRICGRTS